MKTFQTNHGQSNLVRKEKGGLYIGQKAKLIKNIINKIRVGGKEENKDKIRKTSA